TPPQKALPRTFPNHYPTPIPCKHSWPFHPHTNCLSLFPIYHISRLTLLLTPLIQAFTLPIVHKFNPQQILTIIKNQPITHISLLPQTLNSLMQQRLHEPYN
ncbi:AMP-binding protein, partial [Staphylococcus aureus]|uniref:AMP-binding protein n=1 Tax=Staphylococcus aureus TaxID=1280 RepID=UPI0011A6D65C